MTNEAFYRQLILQAFIRLPQVSVQVCYCMSKPLQKLSLYRIELIVEELVLDGLLKKQLRPQRLHPTYEVCQEGKLLVSENELESLRCYDPKILEQLKAQELTLVSHQQKALQFIQSKQVASVLQIQKHLTLTRVNTWHVIAALASNNEIQATDPHHLFWKSNLSQTKK